MLTSSASSDNDTNEESAATTTPVVMVVRTGVPVRSLTFEKNGGQQPVSAHGEEDPALAQHQDHHHRGETDQRTDRDHRGVARLADGAERFGQRRIDLDVGVLDHAGDDQ